MQDADDYSCSFCRDCVKSSKEGRARCNKDFRTYLTSVSSRVCEGDYEAYEFNCHAGLVDLVAPLRMGKDVVSFIFAGQYQMQNPNVNEAEKYAQELEIDPKEYVDAIKKVRVLLPEERDTFKKLITSIAKFLSTVLVSHYDSNKQIRSYNVLKFIMESLYQAMSLDEVFPVICEEVKHLYGLRSVKIVSYDMMIDSLSLWYSKGEEKVAIDLELLGKLKQFWICKIDEIDDDGAFEAKLYDFNDEKLPDFVCEFYKKQQIESVHIVKINKSRKINTFMALYNKTNSKLKSDDLRFLHNLAKGVYLSIENNIAFKKIL